MNRAMAAMGLCALLSACGASNEPATADASPTAAAPSTGPRKIYDSRVTVPAGEKQRTLAQFAIQGVSRNDAANNNRGVELAAVHNGTAYYVVAADLQYEVGPLLKTVHCKHARDIAPGETSQLSCGSPSTDSITDPGARNFSATELYTVYKRRNVLVAKPIKEAD